MEELLYKTRDIDGEWSSSPMEEAQRGGDGKSVYSYRRREVGWTAKACVCAWEWMTRNLKLGVPSRLTCLCRRVAGSRRVHQIHTNNLSILLLRDADHGNGYSYFFFPLPSLSLLVSISSDTFRPAPRPPVDTLVTSSRCTLLVLATFLIWRMYVASTKALCRNIKRKSCGSKFVDCRLWDIVVEEKK